MSDWVMFKGNKKGIFWSNEINNFTETLERDVFRISVRRYSDDIAGAMNASICMAESAVRKETMKIGIVGRWLDLMGKEREWVVVRNLREYQHSRKPPRLNTTDPEDLLSTMRGRKGTRPWSLLPLLYQIRSKALGISSDIGRQLVGS